MSKRYDLHRLAGKRGVTQIVVVEGDQRHLLKPRFDLRRHSPDGFEWGYGGSGPAQAALAILCDYTGDDQLALRWYQEFKAGVLANIAVDRHVIESGVIDAWLASWGLSVVAN